MMKERKIGSVVTVILSTMLLSACGTIDLPCLLGDCPNADKCGNGMLDSGETCDIAIAAGQPGACPVSCGDGNPCISGILTNPGTCIAMCMVLPCISCGDGLVGVGETCDTAIQAGQNGACPTSCTAPDACTTATLTGTFCTAKCVYTPIVPCPTCDPPLVYHPGLGMCASLEGLQGLGADCSTQACKQGQLCTSYYGIAGSAGGLYSSCVLPCGPSPDNLCPEGFMCGYWFGDGPTIATCSR